MRDIVIFSTADWDNPFWTNKQHMATQFARRGCRVLYVDSIGLRRPLLHGRDLRRICRRMWKALPLPRQVYPNIWRVAPLVLPLHSSKAARALNSALLQATLRWHLALLGMHRPLLWTYHPLIEYLCTSLDRCGLVYHCVDDLGAAPYIDAAVIRQGERSLAALADLCFVTSPLLRERMSGLFSKVIYEPNACDQNLFATAGQPLAEPEELRCIPRPRLLFVGALSAYKVDFPLMEYLAGRLPQTHWLLIGSEGEGQPESPKAPRLPNIHVLGPRAHGRLPYYMAHADAAVMPVPHNPYTDAMFPMKFFEYLAAGLPLVGTRLPALAEFEDLYFPADRAEDFAENILRVLAGERRDAQAIEAACRCHSWEARFARMEMELDACLAAPPDPLPHGAVTGEART
jgi:glycosyltransferase involved in cell wall biosynthesis